MVDPRESGAGAAPKPIPPLGNPDAAGEMKITPRAALLVIVVVHHGVAALHGAAHAVLQIELTPFQMVYVTGVIIVAPLVGAALLFTRHAHLGAVLLVGSMFAALVFGLVYHVLLPGPDNISTVGPGGWAITFQATGVALSGFEGMTGVLGTLFLRDLVPRRPG